MSLLDLLPVETLDAITAGVKREPLVGKNHRPLRPPRMLHACQIPEGDGLRDGVHYASDCPGCTVAMMVGTVDDPERAVTLGIRNEQMTSLAGFRACFDELDPERVLVERELARRGIQ